MKKNRLILGYLLILFGIGLPLFAFGKLSDRILLDQSRYSSYMDKGDGSKETMDKKIEVYNEGLGKETAIVDPFSNEDYVSDYSFMKNKDAVFAYLNIPKLDLKEPIYLDASKAHLAKGVAHIEGTDLPSQEPGRRAVIAGHRGYYEAIMFLNLHKLDQGDSLSIDWPDQSYHYQVIGKEVIRPWEVDKLNPVQGEKLLTLLTCNPLRPPRKDRLLVNCRLIEEDPAKEKPGSNLKEKIPVDKDVKKVNRGILLVTLALGLAFIFTVFKFLGAIFKK